MDTEQKNIIIAECRELMSKAKYSGQKTEQFCDTVSDILQEIIDRPDEQREIRCRVVKHIDRVEFRIDVSGDRIDPMTDGKGAEKRNFRNKLNSMLLNPETSVSVSYTNGWNRLVVRSPSRLANSKLLSEPMILAMLLGAVAGFLCRFLPKETRSVFLDKIAAPLMSAVMSLLMGIMGPVIFLFIIISVSSFRSMEELSKIGKVILKRFVLLTLWVAIIASALALVFFPVFGKADSSVGIPEVEGVLLGILPKNFVTPFAEGRIPQIILFGLLFGVALLMMGDSGKPVRDGLLKVKEWVMGVMILMMKILPIVPFISTMMIIANGNAKVFLQSWKYIAAAYICYLLTLLIEFIAVSVRCKKGIPALFKMLKGLMALAFVTAMPPATMSKSYEVSEKDMGIDRTFSDLWITLSNNLLSPARTISLVLSVFFIADMTGATINVALMIIILITVIPLSFASSETVSGAAVLLETLELSTDMVGMFSAFEIFTRNAAAAYDISYSMLEQLDAARETGMITGDK